MELTEKKIEMRLLVVEKLKEGMCQESGRMGGEEEKIKQIFNMLEGI